MDHLLSRHEGSPNGSTALWVVPPGAAIKNEIPVTSCSHVAVPGNYEFGEFENFDNDELSCGIKEGSEICGGRRGGI